MNLRLFSWLGITVMLMLFAISHDSLWIDEGDTAVYAIQPTFEDWRLHLLSDPNADCQFPLYMFLVWVWSLIFGTSEFALRALNVPFAAIACVMFYLLAHTYKVRLLAIGLLIQPYFWFYLNEARPYMLQIATGSMVTAGFLILVSQRRERLGWALFLSGTVLLYYSTLLSFVTLFLFFSALAYEIWHKRVKLPTKWPLLLISLTVFLIPGGLYYLHTVLRGVGGAKLWPMSLLNWIWVIYETIGAVGLGPSVREIREIARATLNSGFSVATIRPFIFVIPYAFVAGSVIGLGLSRIAKTRNGVREVCWLIFLFGGVLILFGIISVLMHKAFWARHLAPIFAAYGVCFTLALSALWKRTSGGNIPGRLLVTVCCAMMLASSLFLVFSPIHRKDDYRAAAAVAKESLEKGLTVWWAGSWHCATYYGLPVHNAVSTEKNFKLLLDVSPENIMAQAPADMIILSRPDVYDNQHAVRGAATTDRFMPSNTAPHAFEIWRAADKGESTQ